MKQCFAVLALWLAVCVWPVSYAFAQASCRIDYEVLVRLDPPPLPSYSVMTSAYGLKDAVEVFKSAVRDVEKNHYVMATQRYYAEGGPMQLILVALDRRGRVAWEQEHDIPKLSEVVKLIRRENGYVVFGNKNTGDKVKEGEQAEIWIGFFDGEGKLEKEKTIKDKTFELSVHDAVFNQKKSQYVLAVSSASHRMGGETDNALIYRLDMDGKVLSFNGYAPGLKNRLLSITQRGDDFLATGYIGTSDGRKAGWVVMLAENGSIVWQRQYPRGDMAVLYEGQSYIKNHVIVGGEAHPVGDGAIAAWVMALDAGNGTIIWQRYYRGDMNFTAQKIITHEDGLISVLIDAAIPEKKDTDVVAVKKRGEQDMPHAKLLTLTPRGTFFSKDTFLNGMSAVGYDMIMGSNMERVMIGSSKVYHRPKDFKQGDDFKVEDYSVDGWILAAVSNDPYRDPCR